MSKDRKFILVFSYNDPDDIGTIPEVEYFKLEEEMHARVTELASKHARFYVDCAARLAKQWTYVTVQQPIEMKKVPL